MQGVKHIPTNEQRALVTSLVLAKESKERIAKRLGIDLRVLMHNYENEIDMAKTDLRLKTNAQVIKKVESGNLKACVISYEYICDMPKASVSNEQAQQPKLEEYALRKSG